MKSRLPILLLFLALALPSVVSAVPDEIHLWKIPVVRFMVNGSGQPVAQRGLLDTVGRYNPTETTSVPESVVVPPEAFNRYLISMDAWLAYERLSPVAVQNFAADPAGGVVYRVGERDYLPILPSQTARFDLGDVVNISTRATVIPGGEPMIGGFVILHQPRRVLIRAVGPTLADLGVTQPLADPYITVYESGSNAALIYNDDWGQRYNADEIRQMAKTLGAFPLREGSMDSAYLVELDAGIYTVHLTTYGDSGGTALLEIYAIP